MGQKEAYLRTTGEAGGREILQPLKIKMVHRHCVQFHYLPLRIVTSDNSLNQIPNIISPHRVSSLNKVGK